MTYRDDREALHARIAELERQRDQAQEEAERAKAEAELEVERIRQADRDRRRPRNPAVGRAAVMGVLVFAAAGVGVAITLSRSPAPAPVPPSPATTVELPVATPTPRARKAEAVWSGRVRTATGRDLAPSTPCTLSGRFTSDGTTRVDAEVDVDCGGQRIYGWNDMFAGMEMRECTVWEGSATPAGYEYRLRCQDHGPRSGRAQMTIDTYAHTVSVWSEAPPVFRVELEVDEASAARVGEPLYVANLPQGTGFQSPVHRIGRVRETSGDALVTAGATCSVDVHPSSGRYNCRVQVDCGGQTIYGGGTMGYTECAVESGAPVRALDPTGSATEGDPKLDLDLATGRVVVSDDPPQGPWSVTIAVDAG